MRKYSATFLPPLCTAACALFDARCQTSGTNPMVLRRIVFGRNGLNGFLHGFTNQGEKLFTMLHEPLPGGGRTARAAKKTARKTAKQPAKSSTKKGGTP